MNDMTATSSVAATPSESVSGAVSGAISEAMSGAVSESVSGAVSESVSEAVSGPESPRDESVVSSQPEGQKQLIEAAGRVSDRAVVCIDEFEALLKRMEATTPSKTLSLTGVPSLVKSLRHEQANIEKIKAELREESLGEGQLRSYENKLDSSRCLIDHAILKWSVLKRCKALGSINQSFQGSTKELRRQQVEEQAQLEDLPITGRERHLLHRTLRSKSRIDIDVAEGGALWLEIRPISLNRLARHMSDAGWAWGDYDGPDEDVDPEEWQTVPLANQVKKVIEAAKLNRHEYTIPKIFVVLPRIGWGDNDDVDIFLSQLTRIDSTVDITIQDRDSEFLKAPEPPLEEALDNLVVDELDGLTSTLNVDHTILIDLISDITHFRLTPQPWQTSTTRWQIQEEARVEGGLMASTLYPILAGRQLVCTHEAAAHFHDVLRTVGTDTERERGRLLIPWDDEIRALSPDDVRTRFNALTSFPLPDTVQIPIAILPTTWSEPTSVSTAVAEGRLPAIALDVARAGNFGSSKLSIYMQGWASGDVTVTSNKEIRGQFRTWVEANRREEGDKGPRIYRMNVTRNLLAKSATPPEGWTAKEGDEVKGEMKEMNGAAE